MHAQQGLDAASLLGGSDEKEVVEVSAATLRGRCQIHRSLCSANTSLYYVQVKAAHGVQDELMGAFSKEETRDDLEKDPEMCVLPLSYAKYNASLLHLHAKLCPSHLPRKDCMIHQYGPTGRSTSSRSWPSA